MASGGLPEPELGWPFGMIEPLFYEELEKTYPYLPEWTLERIPKNVNTNRLKVNKNTISNDWSYARYNGSGAFRCTKCIKYGLPEKDASWHSAYVTFLFRGYFGLYTEDDKDYRWCGSVQTKAFAQGCKECGEYMPCEIDQRQAQSLAKWICRWIASHFHEYPVSKPGYRGDRERKPHMTKLCEAKGHKWCKFCNG